MESEYLLDLKIQKKIETIFQQTIPCIDKLQKDNELQKQSIQILTNKVQELEKEVELLKIIQKRRYKKTIQQLLSSYIPQGTWLEYIQEWRNNINQNSLEQVFTASTFLETFLMELKKIKPTIISFKDNTIQIPEIILPILCVKNENKTEIYIYDNELKVWTNLQYIHLRKLITIYIYRIRECWLNWQENNQTELTNDKYNNYISKPVSILYNESYKNKMIQTILSSI